MEDVTGGEDQPPVERSRDDKVKVMIRDPSSVTSRRPCERVATAMRVQEKKGYRNGRLEKTALKAESKRK